MTFKVLSPESRQLTLICGLGWPDPSRYYLSRRDGGIWEFWEQPAGSRQARLVFGWVEASPVEETDVAKRLLSDYLGTFRPGRLPRGEGGGPRARGAQREPSVPYAIRATGR